MRSTAWLFLDWMIRSVWLETDWLTVELHGIHRDTVIGLQPFKDYYNVCLLRSPDPWRLRREFPPKRRPVLAITYLGWKTNPYGALKFIIWFDLHLWCFDCLEKRWIMNTIRRQNTKLPTSWRSYWRTLSCKSLDLFQTLWLKRIRLWHP